MSYGVIGNTSGFEPEESRFEPLWDNKVKKIHKKLAYVKNSLYICNNNEIILCSKGIEVVLRVINLVYGFESLYLD